MIVSAIVALSKNKVIGLNNSLPWHIPQDLKHFRQITTGHPVIMGRKTFESIGRVLPNRENVIISRQEGFKVEGARRVASPEAALALFRDRDEEVFFIGGAEIYRSIFPQVQRLYLTQIHQEIRGDSYFPDFDRDDFVEVSRTDHPGEPSFSFILLERQLA